MRYTILTGLALVLVAGEAGAAEWRAAIDTTLRSGAPAEVAEAHLAANAGTLALGDVSLARARVLGGRYRTVRFVQEHRGLPVVGGQVAVRLGPDGRVRVTVMEVARGLTVDTTPAIDEGSAREVAASAIGLMDPWLGRAERVVVPSPGGGLLVWQIDLPTLDGGRRVWIDAQSGELLLEGPLARHAKGRVYPISSVVTPDVEDVELVDLVESAPQLLTGWDGNLVVTNYVSGDSQTGSYTVEQLLEPNSGSDFLYDPPADSTDATDGFAQVGVYYHLTRMRDYFTTVHGLDMSGASWKVVAMANALEGGQPLDNAFFSPYGISSPSAPNLIAIGQGSNFDFAEDSDVFNHEFTHYVNDNAVGYNAGSFYIDTYGRSPFSAAIDEGLSDYFACTVNGDEVLGEASLAPYGQARDLSDTGKTCPDDMAGEAHADGEIIGSAAWTLREMFGAEIADQLVWRATTMLTFGASFGDFAQGVLAAAGELVADGLLDEGAIADIEAAYAARGLTECFPELPLRSDEPRTANLRGYRDRCESARMEGRSRQTMFHYVVTPGAEAVGVKLDVHLAAEDGSTDFLWNLYARRNDHVTFVTTFPPTVFDRDYEMLGQTTPDGSLVIDATSNPPFEPGVTYHLVMTATNCSSSTVTFTTEDLLPPSDMGEGGAAPMLPEEPAPQNDDDVVVSCSCRFGEPAERTGLAWAAFALGLVAVARRRRS